MHGNDFVFCDSQSSNGMIGKEKPSSSFGTNATVIPAISIMN